MQTSYSQNLAIGRAGMLADNTNRDVVSKNASASSIPFGLAVVQGSADNECKLPASSSDVTGQGSLLGVALVDMSVESQLAPTMNATGSVLPGITATAAQYLQNQMVAILKKGKVLVTVEENVTPASPVFVRFATDGGSNTQPGSFRASADGTGSAVAQVDTLTPTAVNSTQYFVTVRGASGERTYEFTSDGSATAAKIVTGFLALMANDLDVAVSGTSTLVLTSKVAGTGFTTTADSNMAVAHTTANASTSATAVQITNAAYRSTATAGNLAVLEVNLP
jgi:hypothetical protein